MSSIAESRIKYRVSLTVAQIEKLITLLKQDATQEAISVLRVLVPMKAKIDCEAIAPAYVTSAKIVGNSGSNGLASICNFEDAMSMEVDPLLDDSNDDVAFNAWRSAGSPEEYEQLFLVLNYGHKRGLLNVEEERLATDYGVC